MAVTRDQVGANSNATPALSGTVTVTINANSLVIVTVTVDDSGTTTFNVPTATGLTFVQIGTTQNSSTFCFQGIFRAYTTASLGSTVITASWNTTSEAWVIQAATFTGTAGTSVNNGSDAIGGSTQTNNNGTPQSVTVNSTSHDNSKYFGGFSGNNAGSDPAFVKGANYTNVNADLWNTVVAGFTEISTNPVTPAANTAVNGTAGASTNWCLSGIELLVTSGGTVPDWRPRTIGPTMRI